MVPPARLRIAARLMHPARRWYRLPWYRLPRLPIAARPDGILPPCIRCRGTVYRACR